MADVDDFLASVLPPLTAADTAMHNGDPGPRIALWSRNEPVQHTRASVDGGPPESYALRVTTVFRREDGEWRAVHRHADPVPDSDSARAQLGRLSGERRDP